MSEPALILQCRRVGAIPGGGTAWFWSQACCQAPGCASTGPLRTVNTPVDTVRTVYGARPLTFSATPVRPDRGALQCVRRPFGKTNPSRFQAAHGHDRPRASAGPTGGAVGHRTYGVRPRHGTFSARPVRPDGGALQCVRGPFRTAYSRGFQAAVGHDRPRTSAGPTKLVVVLVNCVRPRNGTFSATPVRPDGGALQCVRGPFRTAYSRGFQAAVGHDRPRTSAGPTKLVVGHRTYRVRPRNGTFSAQLAAPRKTQSAAPRMPQSAAPKMPQSVAPRIPQSAAPRKTLVMAPLRGMCS